MATARDVAGLAGTSTAVVSYVLNNGPRPVAASTRQKVLAAAEQLRYRPNALARALSAGRTFSIGLVLPQIRNPYFAALAEQIEAAARARNHLLLIGDAAGDIAQEKAHLGSFIERQVDGIILVSLRSQHELETTLDTGRVPVVALHQLPEGINASSLSINFDAAARDAATHLMQHGYKNIGALTGPLDAVGTDQHISGIRQASLGDPTTRVAFRTTSISRYDAAQTVRAWLQEADRPRALYCSTDEQAFGALFAAWRAGLTVPGDLAVMGFDGTQDCAVSIPPLSAIRQPVPEMAARAVEILLSHDPSTPQPSIRVTLDHELVTRASCGC